MLVLEGQYIHTSRENKTLKTEYFWQTEREGGVHDIRLWGEDLVLVFPVPKLPASNTPLQTSYNQGKHIVVTGSERLFIGNQMY